MSHLCNGIDIKYYQSDERCYECGMYFADPDFCISCPYFEEFCKQLGKESIKVLEA